MKKGNRVLGSMDDRPMSHEEMDAMIKRLKNRKSDMDPLDSFPEEPVKKEDIPATA